MAMYDDPRDTRRRKNIVPRSRSFFPAIDRMVRGGTLAQGWSNRELLGSQRMNYTGQTNLMRGAGAYSPEIFNLDARPEISPRSGAGLLTPMFSPPRPQSFFGSGGYGGLTNYQNLDQRSLRNTFGYQPTFGLGMNNADWAQRYGFGF